jgi:hypothetical protein
VAPTQAKVNSKNSAACMTFLRVITMIAENTPMIAKRKKKKYMQTSRERCPWVKAEQP